MKENAKIVLNYDNNSATLTTSNIKKNLFLGKLIDVGYSNQKLNIFLDYFQVEKKDIKLSPDNKKTIMITSDNIDNIVKNWSINNMKKIFNEIFNSPTSPILIDEYLSKFTVELKNDSLIFRDNLESGYDEKNDVIINIPKNMNHTNVEKLLKTIMKNVSPLSIIKNINEKTFLLKTISSPYHRLIEESEKKEHQRDFLDKKISMNKNKQKNQDLER